MQTWWNVAAAVLGGVLLSCLCLVAALWALRPDDVRIRDGLRLLPDVVGLLRRLATDPALPRGSRVVLCLLLAYLLLPVDVVPDAVPVLGYADDAVVVALALRYVVRRAGWEALDRHWRGTPDGLEALRRLAGPAARRSTTGAMQHRPGRPLD
ncbi:MAG: DUF1232 domain-containing protein [Actinomycetota bacterium]|nr:DUF1232 domain-containing protein [Actinomycetota bacterium]